MDVFLEYFLDMNYSYIVSYKWVDYKLWLRRINYYLLLTIYFYVCKTILVHFNLQFKVLSILPVSEN